MSATLQLDNLIAVTGATNYFDALPKELQNVVSDFKAIGEKRDSEELDEYLQRCFSWDHRHYMFETPVAWTKAVHNGKLWVNFGSYEGTVFCIDLTTFDFHIYSNDSDPEEGCYSDSDSEGEWGTKYFAERGQCDFFNENEKKRFKELMYLCTDKVDVAQVLAKYLYEKCIANDEETESLWVECMVPHFDIATAFYYNERGRKRFDSESKEKFLNEKWEVTEQSYTYVDNVLSVNKGNTRLYLEFNYKTGRAYAYVSSGDRWRVDLPGATFVYKCLDALGYDVSDFLEPKEFIHQPTAAASDRVDDIQALLDNI